MRALEGVPVKLYLELLAKGLIEKEWVPYEGERGGKGWQDTETGEVLYQYEKPGEERTKAPEPVLGISLPAEEALKRLSPFKNVKLRTKNAPLPDGHIRQYLKFVHQHAGLAFKGVEKLQDMFPTAKIWGRLKSAESLRKKIGRKGAELGPVDIIGTTVMAKNYADMDSIRKAIGQQFEIEEEQTDFLTNPSAGFYRAVHYHVKIDGGSMEIQVMSKRMRQLKEWGHDLIYNGSPQANNKTYRKYANDWGNYIHALDSGKKVGHHPPCPEELHKNHDCFDTIEHKQFRALENLRKEIKPLDRRPYGTKIIENTTSHGTSEEVKNFDRAFDRFVDTERFGRETWGEAEEIEIPISQIRTDQRSLTLRLVRAGIRRYSSIPPGTAYRHDDLFWINNGNHRVAAGRLLGEEFIRMNVIDL